MKKLIIMNLAVAAMLLTSCASKKALTECQTENKSLSASLQASKEDLAGKNARITSLEEQLAAQRQALAEQKKNEYNDLICNPYQAAEKGYIEDIIEPRNTRFRVIRAFDLLEGKRQEIPAKKHRHQIPFQKC